MLYRASLRSKARNNGTSAGEQMSLGPTHDIARTPPKALVGHGAAPVQRDAGQHHQGG